MIKFNLEELKKILISIYRLSHIKVSIFDDEMNEILYYPSRYQPFCSLVRGSKEGSEVCQKSDIEQLNKAKKNDVPITFICPHGLVEHFVPINVSGVVVGYLTLGQVFETTTSKEEVYEKIKNYGLSKEESDKAFELTPHIEKEMIEATNLILNACAKYAYLSNYIEITPNDLSINIAKYIADNIKNKITVDMLCKEFYISRVALYNLFEKKFNDSVAGYIQKVKMDKALEMLKSNNEYKIYEISESIGEDPNYFTKLFQKKYGVTPKSFQKKYLKETKINLVKDGGGIIFVPQKTLFNLNL